MTISEFSERAGCMAVHIARAAGYSQSTFNSSVYQGLGIRPKRAEIMAGELRRIAGEFSALADDLKPPHTDTPPDTAPAGTR